MEYDKNKHKRDDKDEATRMLKGFAKAFGWSIVIWVVFVSSLYMIAKYLF